MYMDDIKLFAENEKELETLKYTVWIETGHRDGISHRKMSHVSNKNRQTTPAVIELLNQWKIRTLGEKGTYKYLGILEADSIK